MRKLDAWAVKKVGEEPRKPMDENSTKKSDIKVGKKFEGLSKKEKSTKRNNPVSYNKLFPVEFLMEVNLHV